MTEPGADTTQSLRVYGDVTQLELATALVGAIEAAHEAERKYGRQERTAFEWAAYIMEEAGEAAAALSDFEYGRGRVTAADVAGELSQLAALAVRLAAIYRRGPDGPPAVGHLLYVPAEGGQGAPSGAAVPVSGVDSQAGGVNVLRGRLGGSQRGYS